jgi:hypothetical protein
VFFSTGQQFFADELSRKTNVEIRFWGYCQSGAESHSGKFGVASYSDSSFSIGE